MTVNAADCKHAWDLLHRVEQCSSIFFCVTFHPLVCSAYTPGLSISCTTPGPATHTSTVHMQVKGHKSKSRKRKLEGTSTSDRSVLINDNGETQYGDDVCVWICTHYLLCHCCSGPTSALLCNAVRHLQILMITNLSSLRAGTATSWNHDDNHRVSRRT